MNCPQLLKPRACRSALCLRTADSNSKRGINCKICEKILLTRVKAERHALLSAGTCQVVARDLRGLSRQRRKASSSGFAHGSGSLHAGLRQRTSALAVVSNGCGTQKFHPAPIWQRCWHLFDRLSYPRKPEKPAPPGRKHFSAGLTVCDPDRPCLDSFRTQSAHWILCLT
jgi:hypothetical protein